MCKLALLASPRWTRERERGREGEREEITQPSGGRPSPLAGLRYKCVRFHVRKFAAKGNGGSVERPTFVAPN